MATKAVSDKRKAKSKALSEAMMGNQNALGSTTNGRPSKYDLIKEAKDLEEWSAKPDSTSMYQFTNDKDYLHDELDDFADRCPVFALAFKKAKERVGQRREEYCNAGTMNYGVWNRSQAIYHSKLHKFERAEKAYDVEIKTKAEAASMPPQDAIIEKDNENMALKAQLAELKAQIDNLTKARQELPRSNTSL
jgi:hypothetical protein